MSPKDENPLTGEQTFRVPKIDKCRGVRFGLGNDIVYCLTAEAHTCGFALRFGSSFLCLHPKRGEIAARTGN
jgi:hypothetical protein